MARCPTSSIPKEMKTQTMMKVYVLLIGSMSTYWSKRSVGQDVQQQELLSAADGAVNWHHHFGKPFGII